MGFSYIKEKQLNANNAEAKLTQQLLQIHPLTGKIQVLSKQNPEHVSSVSPFLVKLQQSTRLLKYRDRKTIRIEEQMFSPYYMVFHLRQLFCITAVTCMAITK